MGGGGTGGRGPRRPRTRRRAGSASAEKRPAPSRPPPPGTPAPPPPGQAATLRPPPTPPPACEAGGPRGLSPRGAPHSPMAGPWRWTRGRGGTSERAAAPASRRPSVRPSLPGLAGAAARRARWGALTGDRSSPLHSSASLARSLPLARPFPPPRPRPLAHRDGGADGAALGSRRPRPGWNPAAGTPRGRSIPGLHAAASAPPPGGRGRAGGAGAAAGRGRRGGGRAWPGRADGGGRTGGAGSRTGGRRAAGAGLRDPLRRSRFPHKLPESGASAALLPASSSPANQQRAPRPAPPISRPALRWPRQPIRPSAPPPGLQPIRTVGRSSQRRGQHEAAAGGGAGSGGAWGEGYGAKGGGGGGFLCRLLGFSPRLQNMSPYPMVTRPWSPNPLAATRPPPREI